MADLKITELTAGTCKTTDVHVAVDTTDNTMAPSGTDKKYTLAQIVNFNDVHSTAISYQTDGENIILCTAPGITITLATADGVTGKVITIIDESNSASIGLPIVIVGQGGETINGLAELKIQVASGAVTLAWSGSGWNTAGVQNLDDYALVLSLASTGSAEGNAPVYYTYKSRGSIGAPTTVVDGDRLYTHGLYAYDGTSFIECGRISFSAGDTVTTNVVPTAYELDLLNGRVGVGALNTAFKFDSDLNASLYDKLRLGNDAPVAPFNDAQLSMDSGIPGFSFGNGVAMRLVENTTAALGNKIVIGRSRGTLGVPAAIQNGDYLFQLSTYGYDGTNWVQGSEFRAYIEEPVLAAGRMATGYLLSLMKKGTTSVLPSHAWNSDLTQTLYGAQSVKYLAATSSDSNQAQIVGVNSAGSTQTVTLLTADLVAGRWILIFDRSGDAGSFPVFIATEGGELINGQATVTMGYTRGGILCVSDGSTWYATYMFAPSLTDGQFLIGDTGSTPLAGNITSSGSSITVTNGPGTINLEAASGAGSPLTTKGDLYTFSTVNARLAVGATDGQLLQVASAAATGLAWSTPTYPSASGSAGLLLRSNGTDNVYTTSTFADTYGASTLLYSNGANTVTGLATANSAMFFTNSTGVPAWTGSATDGQLLIGSTGASPTLATLTQGTGISITNAAGSITIAATGVAAVLPTTVVSGTSQAAAVNNAYYSNNAALVTITLPSTAAVGDVVEIGGLGAGGWKLAQNSSQLIVGLDSSATTTGATGYLASTGIYNSVSVRCIVANTTWSIYAMCGNITFN